MVCQRDEARATVEHLNPDLIALSKQLSTNVTVQSELGDAQDPSSRLEALWKSAREHVKATEWDLVQGTQQLTVAQSKLGHEKLCSKTFEAASLNDRDAVWGQTLRAANTRRFLDASLQKSTEDFFMCV